jgi:hypothetical protein
MKVQKRFAIFILGVFVSTSLIFPANLLAEETVVTETTGTTYYVSVDGSDTNPGTLEAPFRTITHAYDTVAAPGVTIIVKPGTYTDHRTGWGIRLYKAGTATSSITLRSEVKGAAIIDGQNLETRNKGIYMDGSLGGGDYHVIDGFQIKNNPYHGIFIIDGADFNKIINNEIHNNGTTGDPLTPKGQGIYSADNTRDNHYIGNYIHHNGVPGSNLDHGFYVCGDNEIVANNVVVNNASYGIHIAGYDTVSNLKIYNNTVAYNGRSGIILWMDMDGVDIKNNIIYRNANAGIDSWESHGSGVVVDKNLVFGNPFGNYRFDYGGSDYTYTLGSTTEAEPNFIDSTAATLDTHLLAGSPAIDAGLNLSSVIGTDKDGLSRPSDGPWEIGAYEFIDLPPSPPDITAPIISNVQAVGITSKGATISWVTDENSDTQVEYGFTTASDNQTTLVTTPVTLHSQVLSSLLPETTYFYRVLSRDAAGNLATSTEQTFTTLPNNPPVLAAIGQKTVAEAANLSFTISASDADSDTLSYSATTLPAGATFNPQTRLFSWTPTYSQSGTYNVTFEVSDGRGGVDSETVTITVTNTNRAPVANAGPDQTITLPAGATLSAASSFDPDGNRLFFTWSKVSGPSASMSTPNATTTSVAFTGNSGTYVFQVRVSDGSLSSVDQVTVIVKRKNR